MQRKECDFGLIEELSKALITKKIKVNKKRTFYERQK